MEHNISFIRTRTQEYEVSVSLTPEQYDQLQHHLINEGVWENHKHKQDLVGQTLVELGFYTPSDNEAQINDLEDTYEGYELQQVILSCSEFEDEEQPDLYWFNHEGKLIYKPVCKVWNEDRVGYFTDQITITELKHLGYNVEWIFDPLAEEYNNIQKQYFNLGFQNQQGIIRTREYNKKVKEYLDTLNNLKQALKNEKEQRGL
jgi:hypothetical protein